MKPYDLSPSTNTLGQIWPLLYILVPCVPSVPIVPGQPGVPSVR